MGNLVPLALLAGVGAAVIASEPSGDAKAQRAARTPSGGIPNPKCPACKGSGRVWDRHIKGYNECGCVRAPGRGQRSGGVRIVHNRLLGGWYVVRGSSDTPLGGRFDSKADAEDYLADQRRSRETHRPLRAPDRRRPQYTPRDEGYTSDSDEARELELWTENDSDVYHSSTEPVIRNLLRKMRNGTYDHDKALIAWMHVVDAGAESYAREFGSAPRGGSIRSEARRIFPTAVRREVARSMRDYYEPRLRNGELDELVPQPKSRRR